jgi:hypothetical protein
MARNSVSTKKNKPHVVTQELTGDEQVEERVRKEDTMGDGKYFSMPRHGQEIGKITFLIHKK